MKRTWRHFAPALAALTLALTLCPVSALAAEQNTGGSYQAAIYPAEVRESEENGVHRIEKVYILSVRDDPAAIPTADFEREGRSYTLPAALRLDKVVTGTYNFPGTYKIVYRVNNTGEYRTLADSLSTSRNYSLAASPTALGLGATSVSPRSCSSLVKSPEASVRWRPPCCIVPPSPVWPPAPASPTSPTWAGPTTECGSRA